MILVSIARPLVQRHRHFTTGSSISGKDGAGGVERLCLLAFRGSDVGGIVGDGMFILNLSTAGLRRKRIDQLTLSRA